MGVPAKSTGGRCSRKGPDMVVVDPSDSHASVFRTFPGDEYLSNVRYRSGDTPSARPPSSPNEHATLDSSQSGSAQATMPAGPLHEALIQQQSVPILTVLHAHPLAYRLLGRRRALDLLDHDNERDMLSSIEEEVSGGTIQVRSGVLTADRLSACMAQEEGTMLHLSCHGHETYLAFDDGWGEMHMFKTEHIEQWFSSGGRKYQFVFASACDSEQAGLAFVAAGIPHVICCKKIQDQAAIRFAKVLYRRLANGEKLQKAFNVAKAELSTCPHIQNAALEAEKLLLLPRDADHEVVLIPRNSGTAVPSTSEMFPPIGNVFLGRQVIQADVLAALKVARFVTLKGHDVGRRSLARAVSHFMYERRIENRLSEIVWCSIENPLRHVRGRFKTDFKILPKIFSSIQDKDVTSADFEDLVLEQTEDLVFFLRQRKTLFVLDAKTILNQESADKLAKFIQIVNSDTRHVKILLIAPTDYKVTPSDSLDGHEVVMDIPALDWETTLELFERWLNWKARDLCREQHGLPTPKHLCDLLDESVDGDELLTSPNAREMWNMLGRGLPSEIKRAANGMTRVKLDKLVAIAREGARDAPIRRWLEAVAAGRKP